MDCDQIEQEQLLEKYLAAELPRSQRDLLESHLRSCVKCNPRMRKLKADKRGEPAKLDPVMQPRPEPVKPEVTAAKISRFTKPLVATAILVILIGVGFVFWLKSDGGGAASKAAVAVVPVPVQMKTDDLQLTSAAASQELAGFSPLPYTAPIGSVPAGLDARLRTAMELYMKRQFKETAGLLQEILKLAPDFQYARLYLGVCQVVNGENAQAEVELRRVVAAGGPYRDEARFVLAKALFAQGNMDEGSKELRTLAATEGPAANVARRMLPLLDKVK